MKPSRRFEISFALLLFMAGSALSFAFAQFSPDALNSIPSDYEYLSVINVQRFVESPIYARSQQGHETIGQVVDDIAAFAKNTGVDITHDISYLFIAGSTKRPPLMIASGRFNRNKILSYLQSKIRLAQMKQTYQGADIWMSSPSIGIVFLTEQYLAMGDMAALKAALDTQAGMQKAMVSNPRFASLIHSAPFNEMYWFAGISGYILAKAPVPIPLGPVESSIQSITGSFHITDSVVGNITVAANNADAAAKLVDLYKRIAAWGKLSENPEAGVTVLSEGLTVAQNESQVNMSLNFTAESLSKVWNWGNMPIDDYKLSDKASLPAPPANLSVPIFIFKPNPSYTEEARKARVEGVVVVSTITRKDGTFDRFRIIRGLGYGLDESAIKTIATKWRFIPGSTNDRPVDMPVNIEVIFRIY